MANASLLFHFFTLLTNEAQYKAMRASLASAGFNEENSLFTEWDNRQGNAYDPYSAIGEAVRIAEAPYVVICHQDLIFAHGPNELVKALDAVEAIDPQWAVAGNAGASPTFDRVFCVDDHVGSQDVGTRPTKVLTLDENFLVIRRDSALSCSSELEGFHLYGTDICLNAYMNGRSAYVIEYRLRHLGSSQDYRGLDRHAMKFVRAWRRKIGGAILLTPSTVLMITRFPFVYPLFLRLGLVRKVLFVRLGALRKIDRLLLRWRPDWLPIS